MGTRFWRRNAAFSLENLFEFLKITTIALLWVAFFTILLAGFGDYEPSPSFTVHAAGEVRR